MQPHEFTDLTYDLDADGIVTLRFARPERKNGLTHLTALELQYAARTFQSDDDAKAMIVTGAPIPNAAPEKQVFCSGAFFAPGAYEGVSDEIMAQLDHNDIALKGVVMAFLDVDKPVLAAINGAAIGGGLTFPLAAADQIYLSEHAWARLPFANLGICSELVSTYLLPKLLGHYKAKELLFFPTKLPAHALMDLGFGNSVQTHDELLDFTRQRALELIPPRAPLGSMRAMKRIMNEQRKDDMAQTLNLENAALNELMQASDFKEAGQARVEKRSPVFQG